MPNNSTNDGFYQPERLPFNPQPNFEEMVNRTKGLLSAQVLDGIDNLINMMPNYYTEQLNIGGEDIIWLRRKISGVPCPNSNSQEEQCTVSKCPICFGTLYVGGYDNPIKLKMSFNPQKADIDFQQAGLVVREQPTAWTMDTEPIMKSMDLVVTYNNVRYLIVTQESEEKRGKRMYQRLTLTKPDIYDVTYSVPVPSIYGDAYTDFQASIQIAGLSQDFLATIYVTNWLWNPDTGQNDVALPV
jgi:hypothetical protein